MLRLAVDTGGTFTDCVLQDGATGESWYWKVLSTPAAPEEAVLEGIDGLARLRPFELDEVTSILLATTVATNAILERAGARTVLVTTAGFRDVLLMGRAKRYDTFDLHLAKPEPLIARRRIVEVDERVGADGEIVRPLSESALRAMVGELDRLDPEAVAVSFLHSYVRPEHEEAVGAAIAAWRPDLPVSLSSQVSPKHREYERTSTTVANAYVAPVTGRFLDRLDGAFGARGFAGELYAMQSNGGLLSAEMTRRLPVTMVESGPAAGVLLAAEIGRRGGIDRVLSFDMGGTTAKLGAVENGEPAVGTTFEVDTVNQRPGSGLPLNIAAVELVEIGAGGGSIATVDLGVIRVGPESAGADTGPVCYGRGGEAVTISDANLVLGYLDPNRFAGGRLTLDVDAATDSVRAQIAEPLGLSVEAAAWGVHTVANATMERAMRSMSIERGRDPRDYALVAFGGAGPVHAVGLARALGVRRVIVPRGAGVGSAVGMLDAQPQLTVSLSMPIALDAVGADEAIARCYDRLRANAAQSGGANAVAERRHGYLRYAGQGYELRVELPTGPIDAGFAVEVSKRFHRAYEVEYGYSESASSVEAIDWYLTLDLAGAAREAEAQTPSSEDRNVPGFAAPAGTRRAFFPDAIRGGSGHVVECPVYERESLPAGAGIDGPALITDPEATILLPPGDRAVVNAAGHVVVEVASEETAGGLA